MSSSTPRRSGGPTASAPPPATCALPPTATAPRGPTGAWVPGGGLKGQARGEACAIDVAKGPVAGEVGAAGGVRGLASSPDGARPAVAAGRPGGGAALVWAV